MAAQGQEPLAEQQSKAHAEPTRIPLAATSTLEPHAALRSLVAPIQRPHAAHTTAARLVAQPPQPPLPQEVAPPTTTVPLAAAAHIAAEVHAEATVVEAAEALAEAALAAEAEASAEAVEASAEVAAALAEAVVADNNTESDTMNYEQ